MESKNALLAALFKAQGNITMPKKDGTNPHFKSKYATIGAVLEAITGPCQDAGLMVVQSVGQGDGCDTLTTTIYHVESGENITTTCRLPLDKQTAQGVGSAQTYMRRYSLMAMFMLNAEDDDGNGATRPPAPRKTKVIKGGESGKVLEQAITAMRGNAGSLVGLQQWHAEKDANIEPLLSKDDYKKFDHEYMALMKKLTNEQENK